MKFLSVLKAIASKAGKILGVAQEVVPKIAPFLPATGFLGTAITAITRAEQVASRLAEIGTAVTGQGKLALADAFSVEALDIAELVSGREIGDNEKYKRGVAAIAEGRQKILSGIADVLDSLREPESPETVDQPL